MGNPLRKRRAKQSKGNCIHFPHTGMMRYQLQEGIWPASPVNGDEVEFIDIGWTYIFANGRWTVISYPDKSFARPSTPTSGSNLVHPHPTNCKNCGAVLHGNICEYCGTEYTQV